jgi:hypothetical protein
MAGKKIAVWGIFPSTGHAEKAAMLLMESGFTSEDISVLVKQHSGSNDTPSEATDATSHTTRNSGLGGALGSLDAIGSLAIRDLGKFVAGGPVRAILSGIGTDVGCSGLADAFAGIGIPREDARRLEEKIQSGSVMLSVRCSSSVSVTRAENLLKQAGAQDVASDGETAAGSAGAEKRSEARI